MFLIQGVFFQNQEWLGVRMVPIEGMVAVIEGGLIYDMYAGIIRVDPENPGRFVGGMNDHYGESNLSEIIFVDGVKLSFSKKYDRRQDKIRYSFKAKDGVTWIGVYVGEVVGKGLSRCVITEVEDSFNDPKNLMKLLGSKSAHTWGKR
jgi:hypothetical protein